MAFYAAPIARLLEELERLPGIGPKSAQRLAYHILRGDADAAARLADAIVEGRGEAAKSGVADMEAAMAAEAAPAAIEGQKETA